MPTLILLRHGQSTWNHENRFTGWTDVALTQPGVAEAHRAGCLLREQGYTVSAAYTSLLKRAITTLWIVLNELDCVWIPVHNAWRLNERHYGALQGLNKTETAAHYGEAQVQRWRRSYDALPPLLEPVDPRYPGHDMRYAALDARVLPLGESLQTTTVRVLPYWHDMLVPALRTHDTVLVVAHGNSLRALVMYLDQITTEAIVELNIPTGIPLVYELDPQLAPLRHTYVEAPAISAQTADVGAVQANR